MTRSARCETRRYGEGWFHKRHIGRSPALRWQAQALSRLSKSGGVLSAARRNRPGFERRRQVLRERLRRRPGLGRPRRPSLLFAPAA